MKKLAALFLLCLSSVISIACYCGGKKGVSQEVMLRDVIIEGKILSKDSIMYVDSIAIKNNEKYKDMIRESQMVYFPVVKYLVKVDTAYKGLTNDSIKVYSLLRSGNCGMERQIDSTYIFYLNNNHRISDKMHLLPDGENVFWILGCTRTSLVNKLERKKLRKVFK